MLTLDLSWIITFVIGAVTYLLVKQYLKKKDLPPGPFPLPIVGNLLSFRKRVVSDVIEEYHKKYGNIFTLWLGSKPFVLLADVPEIKEAMIERRSDFAGRADFRSTEIFLDGNTSIADSDFSKTTETLRKMGLAAIRKYAVSENLPPLLDDVARETADFMLEEKEPFDPKRHIHHMLSNYIASSLFGKRYKRSDPEFLTFRDVTETLNTEFGNGFTVDFIPFLRFFLKKQEETLRKFGKSGIAIVENQLKQHMASYETGVIRDVIDSLLSAREETIAEGKETAVHMTDMNLVYAIFDLYFASIETSTMTLRWILLYLATFPHIQEKVIEEIQDVIGDRIAVQEDRKRCPFTNAVIYEMLRHRTVVPFLLPHKATCDSQIAGYKIPKNTHILVCAHMVHNNPAYWKDPDVFKPERFLESEGTFTEEKLGHYLPFGKGRRSCIGEKLAIVQIFLVLSVIFRKCRFRMKVHPADLKPDDNSSVFYIPKEYKIVAEPIS